MKETLEGHFCGADDEHYFVYPKEKTLSDLYKKKNTTAEKQKEKVEDEEGKKHSSVCTYIDMINDASQKLKIGFEQYLKAKEDEISKLKKELAKEKSISDSLLSNNLQLVLDLDEAKKENKQQALKLDKVQSEKLQLAQSLDKVQSEKQQLEHRLREVQSEKQQLAHDLGEAQTKSKELARGQGEALAECSMLEYKLEEAQAENQKLSKKLDDARFDIGRQNIAIGHLKKKAERKDDAMQADTSEVKEKIAREMIDSGIRFVKDMKTAIDDSQTFKCMGLLNHMTDDCFGKHESIHRELKDMIQGIFGSREQVAKEQNEPRPNNVTVEKGGVYNAEVHHQDIHHEVDQRDFLLKADHPLSLSEVDKAFSLSRYKRKRLGLEGDDYEWR